MADYKATDTEFTAVANAIRTKGGTSNQLEWPDGFVSAVQAIPSSGWTIEPLSVTHNGTYTPPSGVNGYSPVDVNVLDGVVGFDPDDNNKYYVTKDNNDQLVKTLVPVAIQIDTQPTKTAYSDGESIDFTGGVVKVYNGDGTLYDTESTPDGVVSNSELQFVPSVAEGGSSGTYTQLVKNTPIYVCKSGSGQYFNVDSDSTRGFVTRAPNNIAMIYVVSESFFKYAYSTSAPTNNARSFTYNGKNYYYASNSYSAQYFQPNTVTNFRLFQDSSTTLSNATIVDRTFGSNAKPFSTSQTIKVQWEEPVVDEVLETSFVISLN